MTEEQLKADYEHRMANDPMFRATEEHLNYCFEMDGLVRRPYWEKWQGVGFGQATPTLAGPKPKRPPIPNRKLICVETGEVFESVGDLMAKQGYTRNTVYTLICKGSPRKGKTYRYIDHEGRPTQRQNGGRRTRPVKCLTTGKVYESVKAAAESVGVWPRSIHRALQNKATMNGTQWVYIESEVQANATR